MTRYEVTLYSLGPFAAEYYLYTEIKQRVAQLVQESVDSAMDTLTADQYAQVVAKASSLDDIPGMVHPKLKEIGGILAEYSRFFDESDDGSPPQPVPLGWCSPKLKVLAEILFSRHTPTFQGIVFVEQRHIATCLAVMLPRIPLLAHVIKSDQLVGHGTGGSVKQNQLKGMGIRNQQDTVKLFRERQLNLRESSLTARDLSH